MYTEPGATPRRLMVFLCHASEDRQPARKLGHMLRDAGFEPWLDEERLMPGADWEEEVDGALRRAGAVIICLSKRSVAKDGYVRREIRRALELADEKTPGSAFIFPVKLDDVKVPRHLSRWQWGEAGTQEGQRRLVQSLEERARELESRSVRQVAGDPARVAEDQAVGTTRSSPPVTIAVMGTKGGVGKSVFVSFAAQLFAAAGDDVAIIDLDLAASGTTLAAEGEYGRTKPKSIVTAFDHVARKATNLAPYASGHSEELWDVTPVFLEAIHGGRIWLLPAREPANPGQSFNVVANVLPPKQRGEKLAAVVQEQTDRICQRYPRVRAILVDCGAERNPIYGAAFSKAEKGYILFGPNPEYFGEIKAVRDELLRMYASINPASIHAVANNVMSIADEQRCRAGIAPIPLAAAIPSDPTLSRAHAENLATHIDLGHESVSKSICDALGLALGDRRAATIEAEQVDHLSIVTLFLRGGGLEDFRRKLQTRWRLAVGLGVVAAVALTSLGTAFALTRFGDVHRESAELYWLLAGLPLALALVGAVRLFRGLRPQRRLLSELNEIASGATAGLLPAVARKMQELRRADPGLARRIDRWIEGRQCDERRTR